MDPVTIVLAIILVLGAGFLLGALVTKAQDYSEGTNENTRSVAQERLSVLKEELDSAKSVAEELHKEVDELKAQLSYQYLLIYEEEQDVEAFLNEVRAKALEDFADDYGCSASRDAMRMANDLRIRNKSD